MEITSNLISCLEEDNKKERVYNKNSQGRKAITSTIKLKHKAFVDKFISSGFNVTEAYGSVYGVKNKTNASVRGGYLLTKPEIVSDIVKTLKENFNIKDYISQEFIITNIMKLLNNAKHETTKSRMLELLAKIGNLFNENIVNIGVFNENSDDLKTRIKVITKNKGINKPLIENDGS